MRLVIPSYVSDFSQKRSKTREVSIGQLCPTELPKVLPFQKGSSCLCRGDSLANSLQKLRVKGCLFESMGSYLVSFGDGGVGGENIKLLCNFAQLLFQFV